MQAYIAATTLRSVVALLLCWRAVSREILRYEDGSSSRVEMGQPGNSVSGQWSWMDTTGEKRTIWYVADTNGFRAFGDTIPNDWSKKNIIDMIGTSVLPTRGNQRIADKIQKSQPKPNSRSNLPNAEEMLFENANSNKDTSSSMPGMNIIFDSRAKFDGELTPLRNLEKPVKTNNVNQNVHNLRDISKLPPNLPSPILGTKFVLLGDRNLPTQSAARPNTGMLMPKLVEVSGMRPPVTKGILSGSKAVNLDLFAAKTAKALKNEEFPVERRTPMPTIVDKGTTPNLDNFLRPNSISPNSLGAVTPNPVDISDYDYYDYYSYYDGIDESNSTTSAITTTINTPSTTTTTTTTTTSTTTTTTTAKPAKRTKPPDFSIKTIRKFHKSDENSGDDDDSIEDEDGFLDSQEDDE